MEKTAFLETKDSTNSKSCFKNFHRSSKHKYSLHKTGGQVHFKSFERQSSQNNKRSLLMGNYKQNQIITRPSISQHHHNVHDAILDREEDKIETLKRLKLLRFPISVRKKCSESVKNLTDILNSPIISKSSIVREFKCFQSHSSLHDSYLITKNIARSMKQRLKEINREEQFTFRYEELGTFVRKLQQKKYDELLDAYKRFRDSYNYPISIHLMTLYIGVHLFSINGHHQLAQSQCQEMFDQMIKKRVDICLPVYFILMIKLKTNQGQWKEGLSYTSRALATAWIYSLQDLQVWCYFEMSRAHFALGNYHESQFFKERTEMSILEGKSSIYRDITEKKYQKQLQMVRQKQNYSYDLNYSITQVQLSKNPHRQRSNPNLKAQVYAKNIAENFKIKHVRNLIGRMSEQFVKSSDGCLAMAGNPHFLTHESGIKNLNVYFREAGDKNLFTMQNSFKNTLIIKEMVRSMLLEMKWFVPIQE